MSHLLNCPACSHSVSSEALSCPSCGHKLKSGFFEGIVKKLFVIFILVIVGMFAIGYINQHNYPNWTGAPVGLILVFIYTLIFTDTSEG